MKIKRVKLGLLCSFLIILTAANLSSQSSFSTNLDIEIPPNYKKVLQGEDIIFTTKLLNLAEVSRRDISLNFEVIGENNEVKFSKSETMAVETQASFVSDLRIPKDLKPGNYILKVTLIDSNLSINNKEASSSFEVESKGIEKQKETIKYILTFIILVSLLLIFSKRYKRAIERFKLRRKIKKIVDKKDLN